MQDQAGAAARAAAQGRTMKADFTIDYRCCRCRRGGLKLWRGANGAPNKYGEELLCAECLAPDQTVGSDGKAYDKDYGFATDQVAGWLPAVPVNDTFWSYTSVPPDDVRWWKALPTYGIPETARNKG